MFASRFFQFVLPMIKRLLPLAWRFSLSRRYRAEHFVLPEGRRAFVFLAADYGNLGDVAITAAQRNFLNVSLPDHKVVMVPISQTLTAIDSIAAQAGPNDIVTLIGGGNMGRRYPDIELLRRIVIKAFPDHPIVAFPQSLDMAVENPDAGDIECFFAPYRMHPRLTLCIREHRSLALVRKGWTDEKRLLHVPDIVLSWDVARADNDSRSGAIASWRDDAERRAKDNDRSSLVAAVRVLHGEPRMRDTETRHRYNGLAPAEAALEAHLELYRSAELVLTDRLHGLILAERCGTPVIALDNSNFKVSATVEDWLSDHPAVHVLGDQEEAADALASLSAPTSLAPWLWVDHPAFAPLRQRLQELAW
jgi:pyruvyl transferase EpsI